MEGGKELREANKKIKIKNKKPPLFLFTSPPIFFLFLHKLIIFFDFIRAMAFEEFSQLSKRRREERAQKYKKKILLAVLCTFISLLCIAIGVFSFLYFTDKQIKSDKNNNVFPPSSKKEHVKTSSKIIEIICETTDYKKKCEDTLTKVVRTDVSKPSIDPRAIIKATISAAMDEVFKAINMTHKFKFDKPQDKAAFDVCKKLFQV